MKKFEILPHVADVRIKVKGNSLEELFTAALEGMNYIIRNYTDDLYKTAKFTENIKIDSGDESMLIIDFLSEILTLSHRTKALFFIKKFNKLNTVFVDAVVEGSEVNGFDEDIKAVTYTEASIIKNELNEYETVVVFDI